ncbi:hypothetical protein J2766_000247 [Agrobacterium tumefaciens]|uniref:Uncharacterized protein n=1 Tax=Agrobacterium tumefaciens TaxID=358 RepID=A0AAW8LU14_AGRTU|nr:hypothetical protein [Agrobacterium tumefaciens]MBP2563688.1 hypothetical protein [Agrobacterium tumefaciens]MDR6702449.1 hypothetical protein [Agrobacterium tumefaciens]
MSLKRGGAGWVVRVIRHDRSYGREMVERLGFVWQPDLGAVGAYTTGDAATALALLDSNDLKVVGDMGVEDEVRQAAAAISVTGDATEKLLTGNVIFVTAGVMEIPHEAATPALAPTDAMDAIPVMDTVTEMQTTEEKDSVTAGDTEIPVKRKRGRPAKAEGAMTAAERARRYRRKHAPSWQTRRVDLAASTFDRIERIMLETGLSADEVIYNAVIAAMPEYWEPFKAEHHFHRDARRLLHRVQANRS